jgi:threonine synthase
VLADGAHAIALDGDFDDCQDLVKACFNDHPFRDRVGLSAVNSINWARLMPQIVYYFSAALALGGPQQKIAFSVPTGNFGNVFAGWAAMQMGLPIERLIIASNQNDILTRFFADGMMQRETVRPSLSPSLDIQVSSCGPADGSIFQPGPICRADRHSGTGASGFCRFLSG